MEYTVKRVAELSGISVRTLHYYDEVGLLKPAYYGVNGYRFYTKEQLLVLQQILFFKELGFELKQIKRLLTRSDFDKERALRAHRQVLQGRIRRTQELIETIDKTLNHLNGRQTMKDKELYKGFSQEQQKEYERALVARLGQRGQDAIDASHAKTAGWKQEDWVKSGEAYDAICRRLAALLCQGVSPSSPDVQAVMADHVHWIRQFWTPEQESYANLGLLYQEPDFQKFYEPYHPQLAPFLAQAMQVFANSCPDWKGGSS